MVWWSATKRTASALIAVILLSGAAPRARAGYTAVQPPKRQQNFTHERILEHVYGGDFVSDATGLNFSNNPGVTVTRLEDSGPGQTDEIWNRQILSARAVAASDRKSKTAAYFGASTDGGVQKVVQSTGRGFDLANSGQVDALAAGDLRFGSGNRRKMFSSVASANRDGMDHLVTYEVNGLSGQPASVYLMCWEGKFTQRSDRDYNDLVIEVQAAPVAQANPFSEPLLIPLPAAVWSGLSGLIGVALIRPLRRLCR